MTGRWIFAQEGVGTNDEERTFRKLKSSGVNHGYEVGYLSGGEGMRMELGLVRVPERCLDTAWRAFHTEVKSPSISMTTLASKSRLVITP